MLRLQFDQLFLFLLLGMFDLVFELHVELLRVEALDAARDQHENALFFTVRF